MNKGTPTYSVRAIPKYKFNPESLSYDSSIKAEYEHNLLNSLNHPGVLKAYPLVKEVEGEFIRFGEYKRRFFVFEYVEAETLKSFMNPERRVPLKKKLGIIHDLADVLDYLHTPTQEKTIVYHRDINPENIIIPQNRERHVKLINFKYALILEPAFRGLEKVNSKFNELKTAKYIAPERIPQRDKRSWMNKKSEVFTLGLLSFEILTGFHPFINQFAPIKSFLDYFSSITSDYYELLSKGKELDHYKRLEELLAPEDFPKGLFDMIDASLEYDWKKRPDAKDYLTLVDW